MTYEKKRDFRERIIKTLQKIQIDFLRNKEKEEEGEWRKRKRNRERKWRKKRRKKL